MGESVSRLDDSGQRAAAILLDKDTRRSRKHSLSLSLSLFPFSLSALPFLFSFFLYTRVSAFSLAFVGSSLGEAEQRTPRRTVKIDRKRWSVAETGERAREREIYGVDGVIERMRKTQGVTV